MLSLSPVFDVLAWHRACEEHGVVVIRFDVPGTAPTATKFRVQVNGRVVNGAVFLGLATLWALTECECCGSDTAVDNGTSSMTSAAIAAAIAKAPARCAACRVTPPRCDRCGACCCSAPTEREAERADADE